MIDGVLLGKQLRRAVFSLFAFEREATNVLVIRFTINAPLDQETAMFQATAGARYTFKVMPVDQHGNAAPLDGPATAQIIGGAGGSTLENVAADGLSGVLVAATTASAEAFQLQVTGDARLGADVVPLIAVESVVVVAGEAVAATIELAPEAPTP